MIGAVSFAASWIVQALRGGWRARGVVADLDQKIEKSGAALKNEMRLEHDTMERNHGEALMAVRQKITETEMWNRDNFVRQAHFTEIMSGINRSMDALSAKMDRGFERVGNQIEKLQTRD